MGKNYGKDLIFPRIRNASKTCSVVLKELSSHTNVDGRTSDSKKSGNNFGLLKGYPNLD